MTCYCKDHPLFDAYDWVSFPNVVHTQHRCGKFVKLEVRKPIFEDFFILPILIVDWA